MSHKKQLFRIFLLCIVSFLSSAVYAQGTYPDRPIKLVVGFPAGQATDIVARLLADRVSRSIGQPVVVENRPGQGGSVALAGLAKAAPDGYTFVLSATASLVTNPHLYKSVGYDSLNDFVAAGLVADLPLVMVANTAAPFNTVSELIAYAKSRPGKLSYSSSGNGTLSHLAMEIFKRDAGVFLVHIPYSGSVRAMTDLVAGNVSLGFDTVAVTAPLVEAKRLKVLAVASEKSLPQFESAPTMIKSGMPGFTASPWLALMAPKGTPADALQRWNDEIRKALNDPAMQKSMSAVGAIPRVSSAAEATNLVRTEYAKWGKTVRDSGATVD